MNDFKLGERPWEKDAPDEPRTVTCNGGASSPIHLRREDLGGESLIRVQMDDHRWRLLTSDHAAELVMALLVRIDIDKLEPDRKEFLRKQMNKLSGKMRASKMNGHADTSEGRED